jgi:hypothetical protein
VPEAGELPICGIQFRTVSLVVQDVRMNQTPSFRRRVLQQRPYSKLEWCEQAVRDPEYAEIQLDGRIRHWRYIDELGKHLRVVTLGDGETLHNAFPDRGFKPK